MIPFILRPYIAPLSGIALNNISFVFSSKLPADPPFSAIISGREPFAYKYAFTENVLRPLLALAICFTVAFVLAMFAMSLPTPHNVIVATAVFIALALASAYWIYALVLRAGFRSEVSYNITEDQWEYRAFLFNKTVYSYSQLDMPTLSRKDLHCLGFAGIFPQITKWDSISLVFDSGCHMIIYINYPGNNPSDTVIPDPSYDKYSHDNRGCVIMVAV